MASARADVPVRAVITPFHRPSRAVPEADGHVDGAAARAWRPLLAWLNAIMRGFDSLTLNPSPRPRKMRD